jgi:hypothetical protein
MGHFRVLNKVFLMDNNIKCTWVVGNHIRKLQTIRINNNNKKKKLIGAPKATKCAHFYDIFGWSFKENSDILAHFSSQPGKQTTPNMLQIVQHT